jgi:hypothetical protein
MLISYCTFHCITLFFFFKAFGGSISRVFVGGVCGGVHIGDISRLFNENIRSAESIDKKLRGI